MRLNFEQWRLHFELLRYVALSEISLSDKKKSGYIFLTELLAFALPDFPVRVSLSFLE